MTHRARRFAAVLVAAMALLALGAGCGVGETYFGDFAGLDGDSLPKTPTWTNDVQPRLDFFCTGCHDRDGSQGALGEIDLVNSAEVQKVMALVTQTIADQTMPPGDMRKMTPRDLAILQRWADQGFAQ